MCDYYKRKNSEKRTYDSGYDYFFNTSTGSPEREHEASIENNIFMEKIEELKSNYRKILILLLFQNMKHYEIAETLGLSRTMVSSCLLRIRNKIGDIHLNKVRIRAEMGI